MKRFFVCVAVLVPVLTWAKLTTTANPGPPYFTDDPEPVDFHHYEAYISSQYLHTRASVSATAPHFEFNYGAAPNVQLHVITPLAYNSQAGMPSNYGYGDTELGVKYRFVQESKSTPMVGIFPLIEVPTGDASRGLGNGAAQMFFPVWIQKDLGGGWQTYGGGGYWVNPGTGNRNYWFAGWQAQKQVTKQLSLGGELFYTTPTTDDGNSQLGFNLGAVYDIDDGHHILFSAGKSLRGDSLGQFYLGYQWTFGPHDEKPDEGKP